MNVIVGVTAVTVPVAGGFHRSGMSRDWLTNAKKNTVVSIKWRDEVTAVTCRRDQPLPRTWHEGSAR